MKTYFASSDRMRKLFSAGPTSMSSSCVTFASSHTLPSNLTALHLYKSLRNVIFNFFFTRDELHCYDDVHILRDTASYLQRAVKQSYIPPTWSKIKPCSPQIRRSSGFQPSLRWKAEEENKFWDLSFCRLGESWITEVPKTCSDPRQCIIESIPMSIPWQLS